MFVNYSPEEVKAIKHKRRTLKNREYAGRFHDLLMSSKIILAICRNRRTTQREELIGKCREYEIQIKNIKKQNAMFENTQKKVRQMLEVDSYEIMSLLIKLF